MEELPSHLLTLALGSYAIGCLAALVCWSNDKLANLFAFGSSTLAGLGGVCASVALLAGGATGREHPWEFLSSGLPYLKFSVRLDPLSAFFVLIVSLLGLALSIYSFGYARSFYGRKNVGLLGAFYNALLLATTLVFIADNAFFFLVAWEIMAMTAYFLVSFEHEQTEARNAGVLYFVMSHIGTGCLILAFLLLFQASGGYDVDAASALRLASCRCTSGCRPRIRSRPATSPRSCRVCSSRPASTG